MDFNPVTLVDWGPKSGRTPNCAPWPDRGTDFSPGIDGAACWDLCSSPAARRNAV